MIGKRLMNERVERNIPLTLWSGRWGCQFHFQVVGKTSVLFCLSSLHLILSYRCYDDLSNIFFSPRLMPLWL